MIREQLNQTTITALPRIFSTSFLLHLKAHATKYSPSYNNTNFFLLRFKRNVDALLLRVNRLAEIEDDIWDYMTSLKIIFGITCHLCHITAFKMSQVAGLFT